MRVTVIALSSVQFSPVHYDGQTWTTVFQRDGVHFTGVSGTGANDVLAVGWNGVIFRYEAARSLRLLTTSNTSSVRDPSTER